MTKKIIEDEKNQLLTTKAGLEKQLTQLQKQRADINGAIEQVVARFNAVTGALEVCGKFLVADNTEDVDVGNDEDSK